MPTMERIAISEWEQQQAAKPSHATSSATHPANAALAITKNDGNDNIAPTALECRSDINYYPAIDDTQRDDSKNASAAAFCHVATTPRSNTNTKNGSDDDEEEDSDEEIGAMIYASSKTARARRAAAEVAFAVTRDQSQLVRS